MHNIILNAPDAQRLSMWIYSDPLRCPGLRLHYEAFHELERNIHEKALPGDIPDFAHIAAIPYVDYATVDQRMVHYCHTAARKLKKLSPAVETQTGKREVNEHE
jgi:hypothetical protein